MDINIHINMLKYRRQFFAISAVLMLTAVVLLATRGLNFGMDFTGGTTVTVSNNQTLNLSELRSVLKKEGYGSAVVQHFGASTDAVIRVPPRGGEKPETLGHKVFESLQASMPDLTLKQVEFVGPEVGSELRDKSILAVLVAFGMMLLYVWFRFSQKMGVASVIAEFHEILICLGLFSIFQWEFNLNVVAAILALIGYSINDSIVVADYVREEFRKSREPDPEKVTNNAVCLTLGRTINTSLVTLLVVLALLFFGGPAIHGFAMAMTIGIISGTYSSIYVVCHLALVMGMKRQDFILPEKREVGDHP
jgi:preprotein translocase subunit SecF